MSWLGVEGHDDIVDRFRRAIGRNRLATTYLFVGPRGVGKRLFAKRLAQSLLCPRVPAPQLEPCGRCADCQMVLADSHPDLEVVAKPADRAFLPIELLIGDREHRMRAGLCHAISLTPTRGRRRVAIIEDADDLNPEGANCLLKTLEEPPSGAVLILVGTSPQRQLPTIRSRCQIVRFQPLPAALVARCLLRRGAATSEAEAAELAARAGGSVGKALQAADAELVGFRRDLWRLLGSGQPDRLELLKTVQGFVEKAGTDVAARRQRLREAVDAAAELYRHLLRHLAGTDNLAGNDVREDVDRLATSWNWSAATAADLLEHSLAAARDVDANLNLVTLMESWLHEISLASRTGRTRVPDRTL
jgi:DNA polymerase-3 subunit delta'